MKKSFMGASIVALSLLVSGPFASLSQASADVASPMMLPGKTADVASQVQNIKTRVLFASGKFKGRLTPTQKTELLDIQMNINNLLKDSSVSENLKKELKIELEDVNEMLG